MTTQNELIYSVRSIIGEDEPNGFFTYVKNGHQTYKVPNYLFKDAPAEYPEIRISPFISEQQKGQVEHKYCQNRFGKLYHYGAVFQVDIYATTIPLVNNIYKTVFERIDRFNDFDVAEYGYNKSFKEIEKNVFHSPIYNSRNFNIFRILINNNLIESVDNTDLLKCNTYTINEDGLTICTTLPIQNVRIYHNINGLQFSNNKTQYGVDILNTSVSNKRMLSELEENNVERITFNLNILYHMFQKRRFGPIIDDILVK